MKKAILTSLFVGYIFVSAFAQGATGTSSLSTVNLATTTISGTTDDFELVAYIKIKNTSGTSKFVKVIRKSVDTIPGTENSICWGPNCYTATTDTTPTPSTIASLGIDSTFRGDYLPNGIAGTSHVKYTFYDKNNTSDSICVLVTFDVSLSGIATNTDMSKNTISFASPNPANAMTAFSYSLKNSAQKARLVIYDMLGSMVNQINLEDKQSTIILSTSDLRSGVYFYSFIVDNELVKTQKLTVAH